VELEGLQGVFISHLHHDHLGGLWGLLERFPDVFIYLPEEPPPGL